MSRANYSNGLDSNHPQSDRGADNCWEALSSCKKMPASDWRRIGVSPGGLAIPTAPKPRLLQVVQCPQSAIAQLTRLREDRDDQ